MAFVFQEKVIWTLRANTNKRRRDGKHQIWIVFAANLQRFWHFRATKTYSKYGSVMCLTFRSLCAEWIERMGNAKSVNGERTKLQWARMRMASTCDVREHDILFSLHVHTPGLGSRFFSFSLSFSLRSHVKYELEQNEKSALLNSCTSCKTIRFAQLLVKHFTIWMYKISFEKFSSRNDNL